MTQFGSPEMRSPRMDELPNTSLHASRLSDVMGRRLDQAGYWSIESAVENDLDTLVPSCRKMITHMKITIANMTSYSTAVGPDSSFTNARTPLNAAFMAHLRWNIGRGTYLT